MKCKKCGAELPEGALTCPKCGWTPENAGKTEPAQTGAQGSADSDFNKQYSKAFENAAEDEPKYHIDEELRRKREERYDESFANMTDDEKIKALEAARLARKEKRDNKLKKKEEGGMFSFLKGGKDEPRSAASETARMKPLDGELPKPEEDDKVFASRRGSASSQGAAARSPRRKRRGISPKTALIAGCVLAVAVVAIVIVSVNMATGVTVELPESPTAYTKDNTLYAAYDGKEVKLSDSFVVGEYEPPQPSATPSRRNSDDEDDEDRATPTPEPEYYPAEKKELITFTGDGEGIYYLDNVDLNVNRGKLNYAKSGSKRSVKTIAENVYTDVLVSSDGTGVLFLTGADKYGNDGTLCYWSTLTNTMTELSGKVLPGHYVFGKGGERLLYINEYNPEYNVGNLNYVSLDKGAVINTALIDSDVYDVFGTGATGQAVVYAKNYNTENGCFDLYMAKNGSEERVLITDGSRCEPILLTTADGMYAGGSYGNPEQYYQALYYVSLEGGGKEKISGGLTELVQASKDEQSVIFRKANAEGTAFEYYYAAQAGTEGQLVASNITVLDDPEHSRVCQFAINDDFTNAAYIQGYDTAYESGALYVLAITNGIVGSDKKISDTAYSCGITPDGQTVRYADSYDITWNLVSLKTYSGEKISELATEVGAGAFTFDKSGKYVVYAKNYSLETKTGDVFCSNNKGKSRQVVSGVSSYGLKDNGEIVYYNSASPNFEIFKTKPNGKGAKSVDEGVTEVLAY